MSTPSKLGYISYEAEASFCEDVETFDTRLPIVGEVDVSGLRQTRQNTNPTVQFLNDGSHDAPLPFTEAEFRLRLLLTGLGSSGAGALTPNELVTLLGHLLGASEATSVGTTASGGTATALTVAAGTFSPGRLFRLGAQGDGRGGGQAGVVDSLAGGTLTSLVALPAAPAANDVVYAMATIYALEALAQSAHLPTSLRFRLATAAGRWNCQGCWLKGIGFTNLNPASGGIAEVELTLGTALPLAESASDFPTASPVDLYVPPAMAGGSFHISDVGDSVRNALAIRSMDFQIAVETVPLMGAGGRHPYQVITGVRRTGSRATIGFTIDAGAAADVAAAQAAWLTDGYKQALVTFAPENQKALALYCPRLKALERPTQMADAGLNRLSYSYEALTGEDDTNPVTQSSWRLAIG